jgi:hypothetical protein
MQSFPRPGMSKAARAGDDRDQLDRLAAALVEHDTLNELDDLSSGRRRTRRRASRQRGGEADAGFCHAAPRARALTARQEVEQP